MTENQKEHYFDWASTSPTDKEIVEEALSRSLSAWGNPSSLHTAGKEAKALLDEARSRCSKILNVNEDTLYFTSGGTESDHIPLLSCLNKPQKGNILFSSIEHPAVQEMANEIKKCGWNAVAIPSNSEGIITPDSVKKLITPETAMVFVMAVNNETGAIQPVKEIAKVIEEAANGKRKAKFHVDCVQAAGKIPLDFLDFVDSAAFSAHKICGPRGIGLLYMKDKIEPFLRGGGQEKGIRSGTENVFGALSFAKALEKYAIIENSPSFSRFESQKEYAKDFCEKLSKINGASIIPQARLSKPENYSSWVVQAAFKNIPGQVMLRALDAEGFYISTGSACSSRKNSRPILEAMHVTKEQSENAVRFSFGPLTTKKAMDELFEKVSEICARFN